MESQPNPNPQPLPAPTPLTETTQVANLRAQTRASFLHRLAARKKGMMKFSMWSMSALLTMYLLSAYIIVPAAWRRFMARHPALEGLPKNTKTGDNIPGDPLNVCLIGTEEEIKTIFAKAGWKPADRISVMSSLRIAHTSVLKKKYETAPVSNLYLWGRKQDLAFQYPMKDPSQRHHVRFWKAPDQDDEGRPLWIGAATFDTKVSLSFTTGQITHSIGEAIDEEREKLFKDLQETGYLSEVSWIESFHEILEGANGGGDRYRTDGHLIVGLIQLPDATE